VDSSSTNSPRRVCELLDLPPVAGGYGLLHVINDEDGRRCTAFTTDLAVVVELLAAAWLAEGTGADRVELPGGHGGFVSHPQEFIELVRRIVG
jgi:hypothetical protein